MIHIMFNAVFARVKAEFFVYKREQMGPGEMAHWVKALASKPDYNVVEGERLLAFCLSSAHGYLATARYADSL